jgi:hypothetical protein
MSVSLTVMSATSGMVNDLPRTYPAIAAIIGDMPGKWAGLRLVFRTSMGNTILAGGEVGKAWSHGFRSRHHRDRRPTAPFAIALRRWHNVSMPLDVQPLSTRRQIIRILAMLALLAGSLGLAQLLIRHHVPPAVLRVEFPPPPGVDRLSVNQSAEALEQGVLVETPVVWPQGDRRFLAFNFEDIFDFDAPQYLQLILVQLWPDAPARAVRVQPAVLAGNPALQSERHVGRGEDSMFAIIRLAAIEGHIVAFCFSGNGVMTDADSEFFDDYCTRQIQVRLLRSP